MTFFPNRRLGLLSLNQTETAPADRQPSGLSKGIPMVGVAVVDAIGVISERARNNPELVDGTRGGISRNDVYSRIICPYT
jgi:hypothetical protein